jgi:hypothetical protein
MTTTTTTTMTTSCPAKIPPFVSVSHGTNRTLASSPIESSSDRERRSPIGRSIVSVKVGRVSIQPCQIDTRTDRESSDEGRISFGGSVLRSPRITRKVDPSRTRLGTRNLICRFADCLVVLNSSSTCSCQRQRAFSARGYAATHLFLISCAMILARHFVDFNPCPAPILTICHTELKISRARANWKGQLLDRRPSLPASSSSSFLFLFSRFDCFDFHLASDE